MSALLEANAGTSPGYGNDEWCKRASDQLSEVFECELDAYFVATGTAANSLALACMIEPWEAVLCHAESHIANDESTAPEFMTGGARLVPLAAGHGKLEAGDLENYVRNAGVLVPHNSRAAALSLTQSSELGLVYTPGELAVLTQIAKANNLLVHMDGARFANAIAALGCTPAELSWQAGIDVLCLGATKCGALAAEAVVFFDRKLADSFIHRRKRTGHLLSKGRFFGAQFSAWLENDNWLAYARHANAMAGLLATGLEQVGGARMAWPVQANELFAVLPKDVHQSLTAAGATYYEWPATGLAAHDALGDDEVLVRFVTSFATHPDEIAALLKVAQEAA